MKRKILAVSLLTISVGVRYQLLTNDKPQPVTEVEEQEVKIQVSALKKAPVKKVNLKVEVPTEIDRPQLVSDVLDLQNLDQLKTSLGTNFKQTLKQQNIQSQNLDSFIESFNFEEEFAKEYAKLHEEDVYAIFEVLNHPITQKLKGLEKEAQQKVVEYIKDGATQKIDPVKGNLINEILTETNAMEQSVQMIEGLLESAYTTAVMRADSKATIAEASRKAKTAAKQVSKQQVPLLNKVFEITYNQLSPSELEEYLFFMQKVDARKATELNMQVAGKVMSRYLDGLVGIILDEKESKTP